MHGLLKYDKGLALSCDECSDLLDCVSKAEKCLASACKFLETIAPFRLFGGNEMKLRTFNKQKGWKWAIDKIKGIGERDDLANLYEDAFFLSSFIAKEDEATVTHIDNKVPVLTKAIPPTDLCQVANVDFIPTKVSIKLKTLAYFSVKF